MTLPLSCVVEGPVDAAVVQAVCDHVGVPLARTSIMGGKSKIIAKLAGYDAAAKFAPWLVLVDLDGDADCAAQYVQQLRAPNALLRVAVRQVEAWLLADTEAMARHLGVSVARLPEDPEAEVDAKLAVVNLARRSRRRSVREDLVPAERSGHKVGRGYTASMIEFATTSWRPSVAAGRCESLLRCLAAIQHA